MNDSPDFEKLLALLVGHQVKFLVCGGVAIGLNGFVRTTEDLDILVSVEPQNIQNLIETLKEFGQGYGGDLTPEDLPLEPGAVRILEDDCPLDIFTLMNDKPYEQLFAQSVETRVGNPPFPVRHLNRKALWELKKDSWRDKDRIDAAEMLRRDEENPPQ